MYHSDMNLNANKRKRVLPTWRKIVKELKAGKKVSEVRAKHINPQTQKPYSRKHIWWITKQVQ